MNSVEKINLIQKNTSFRANEKQSEPQKQSKNYFTAPNLILGSLATVGILGLADVLICKGKHINKLTGRAKELEEAATRAANAETRATNAETNLTEANARIQALEKKIGKLNPEGGKIRLHNANPGGMEALRQMRDIYSYVTTKSVKDRIKDFFEINNYELIEFNNEYIDYFAERRANVPEITTTIHAIRDKLTGQFLDNGVVVYPIGK